MNGSQFFNNGSLLIVVGALIASLRDIPKKILAFILSRIRVEMEIPDHVEAFDWIKEWCSHKNVIGGLRFGSVSNATKDDKNYLMSPAPGTHYFFYKNKLVALVRERKSLESAVSGPKFYENLKIIVYFGNFSFIDSIIEEAEKLHSVNPGKIAIIRPGYTDWYNPSYYSSRSSESIVLAENLFDRILEDVNNFYRSEKVYQSRGIPYRRGYLFTGPPGNGKTSAIKSLCSVLKKKIAVISLSADISDNSLQHLMDKLPKNSVLVFEDIDCIFSERKVDEDNMNDKITFSGFLNVLDGIASQEGYIMFMTTNHPEKLDPALTRPGRVDRTFVFDNANRYQAETMMRRFFPEATQEEISKFGNEIEYGEPKSMAQIQEILIEASL